MFPFWTSYQPAKGVGRRRMETHQGPVMKCKQCVELGKESRVLPRGGTSTLMSCQPFYDEKGVYHCHDMNVKTFFYTCSNGHQWFEKQDPMCPGCGLDWMKRNLK